ncbi:RNA polymerase sigma factor [Dyadobacter aurulentus]|uniref:RNA polymerase sigma factor n=1 Tax=Dyadobacter sp. UC 10 TaxID=2605428 RepID=UPI0011F0DC11|nr:sigma-70 family RNA polymerase sigma factor [Dyadobacter sp. UC 10]KAA0992628.1 sigma-70 family RNA polymerase sigma factor [Dyadobacter sp. UC 10]
MKTVSRQSEESLWQAFIAGDDEAFESLVDQIYPSLFHYGSKFSRDKELVRDCIQDVFLKLWESRKRLNDSIPPAPYLFAALRRRIHRQAEPPAGSTDASWEADYFQVAFSVEEELIRSETTRELSRRFTALLNSLPARQKEIILLKYFENLSRDEIADIMQISPQSVSNTLQKSLKWLRINWSSVVFLTLAAFCKHSDKNF